MRKHEQEDSTMFIDVSNGLFTTAKALSMKWHTAMNVICKDEYIPAIQTRRFVQLIRDVCRRVQDLHTYANTRFTQSPVIIVGINVYNDAVRISATLEELKSFVTRHVAMTDEDEDQFKGILNEIDGTLLCLMYAGEYLQKGDLRSALETLYDAQNSVLE